MANDENLKKGKATQFRSGEEAAKKAGSKGGKTSAQNRRKKKNMRDAAKALLEMPVPSTMEKTRTALAAYGISEADMDYNLAVLVAQMLKALKGDTKAAQFLRDSAGFNPSFLLQEQQFEFERQWKSGSCVLGCNQKNNLLDAILDSTKEDIDTDDLSELQQEAKSDTDMVE